MKFRRIILVLAIPVLIQLLNLFCFHFNHHFHAKDFAHGFNHTYSTEVPGLDYDHLDQMLNQTFYYLGNGKQMVAFESADRSYVLKLFNPMRPLKKNWYTKWKYWQRYSSLKWIKREWFQKKLRLKKLFERHKIAYEKLRDETGLIFVHLAPSEQVHHKVLVKDAEGEKHILDLSCTPFVIQKNATLVPQYINRLINCGELEKAKEAILSIQQLLEKRLSENITDRIQTMENNFGFVKDTPIQIDFGRIKWDCKLKEHYPEEKRRILENFHSWIRNNYPELI